MILIEELSSTILFQRLCPLQQRGQEEDHVVETSGVAMVVFALC